jgi:hypothetical protein
VLVLGVGVTLATLPHWRTGEAAWVQDYDELAFYLPLGAAAYRDHPWRLADPTTGGPTYYQPVPAVPGVLAADVLGLGPWAVGLCWRALGGLAVAAGWYLLLRLRFRPFPAAAAACVLLADPGVMNGQLGYVLAKTTAKAVVHPEALATSAEPVNAASLPQWRIFNPVLSWPWWLAFFALTARAVAGRGRWRIAAAGVACGLLFHVYFYLWTTAVAGLALAAVLDRARWRVYLGTLAVGVAVGAPALVAAANFRAESGSDWLLRTDKFLPVGRFDEVLVPRLSVALLAVAWVWVWRRGWEWAWLAATATAALLLLNQTVVTGLQIENFHWNLALGPALSFLLVLSVADTFGRLPPRVARFGPALAGVLALVAVAAGGWLYARAVARSPENARIREVVSAFRLQSGGVELSRGGAVAGDPDYQYLAAVGFGLRPLAGYTAVLSPIPDAELDARVALNAYLLGRPRDQFRAEQDAALRAAKWGPEARSADARSARLAARLAAWDAVATNPSAAVERFDVRVLAAPAGPDVHQPAGWVRARSGPRWVVWVRRR